MMFAVAPIPMSPPSGAKPGSAGRDGETTLAGTRVCEVG